MLYKPLYFDNNQIQPFNKSVDQWVVYLFSKTLIDRVSSLT